MKIPGIKIIMWNKNYFTNLNSQLYTKLSKEIPIPINHHFNLKFLSLLKNKIIIIVIINYKDPY